MQRKAVVVIGMVVIASVAIGSAAFTSGAVDRAATVNVVGDDAAVTELTPGGGTSSGVVRYDSNNRLSIDFSNVSTNADGMNADANYTIGNHNDPGSSNAFNVTNNDDGSHDYTLSYTYDNKPSTDSSVSFTVYTYDSTNGWVDQGSSVTLSAGESATIVMDVNSTGASNGDALSGDLTITAT